MLREVPFYVAGMMIYEQIKKGVRIGGHVLLVHEISPKWFYLGKQSPVSSVSVDTGPIADRS